MDYRGLAGCCHSNFGLDEKQHLLLWESRAPSEVFLNLYKTEYCKLF